MNIITLAGTLGRDAEIKYLNSGDPICNFSVADSQGRDKPTIWWNCTLFGKRAESLHQYLTKGLNVTVVGQVSEREWVDKDGAKRKSIDVRVQDVAMQGRKGEQQPAKQDRQQEQFEDKDIPF